MVFGGMQSCTLQDFPGIVAAVVFTRGCNLHCPYCHNPQLFSEGTLTEAAFFDFLKTRTGKIHGVVVSGGEPTMQSDLIQFLARLQQMALRVKLDTNGCRPDVLRELWRRGLVDYVAVDLKDLPSAYGTWLSTGSVEKTLLDSLSFLRQSDVPHEVRTTVVAPHITQERLLAMSEYARGSTWYLQDANTGDCLKPGTWFPVPHADIVNWHQNLLRDCAQDIRLRKP